ncbi:MAG TPA: hypothetical protein VHT05_13930 [Candidatus Elarobacter sp.]|jgi:ribonuclease I|nr:hypothetical protein [Candidatus Elarobacter sp.]
MHPARRAALAIVLASSLLAAGPAASASVPLVPKQHGDFDHYTLALTWQPGICTVDGPPPTGGKRPERCSADQPHTPLVGLHGLWASEPRALQRKNVPVQTWWARGCDLYGGSGAVLFSGDVAAELDAVVPHYRESLILHEYGKHVLCFGFDPVQFFTTALAMRRAVADASFGRYLTSRAGRTAEHAAVVRAFERSFGTNDAGAIQLECGRDSAGHEMLTQLWINVKSDALAAFPAAASLTHTAIDQDTCPAAFLLPSW